MDGRQRAYDNIYIEAHSQIRGGVPPRLPGGDGEGVLAPFTLRLYNDSRPHQALGYRTPAEVYGVRDGPTDRSDSRDPRMSPP